MKREGSKKKKNSQFAGNWFISTHHVCGETKDEVTKCIVNDTRMASEVV